MDPFNNAKGRDIGASVSSYNNSLMKSYKPMKTMNYAPVYWIVNLVFLLTILSSCRPHGVNFTIKNLDSAALDSVEVQVTGNEYFIGRIEPGEEASVLLQVKDDSHIVLRHTRHENLIVDVYLQPPYRGTVDVEVTADSVLTKERDIKVGFLRF